MTSRRLRVFVVEDDEVLRELLALHLARAGHETEAFESGDVALEAHRRAPAAVLVLDVSLPGRSGIEICAALRGEGPSGVGILIVTARASEADVLLGFDAGADDYVVKPCRPREVVARVAALARRLAGPSTPARAVVSRGRLSLDLGAMKAVAAGVTLDLTRTEFALLAELVQDPGVIKGRKELLAKVWNVSHEGYARNVDCHVTRLRRKLEAAGLAPAPIDTVHGVGYRFGEVG